MKFVAVILLFGLATCAFAVNPVSVKATPAQPVWPGSGFSASVIAAQSNGSNGTTPGQTAFYRIFSDSTLNASRLDTYSGAIFTVDILTEKLIYSVTYNNDQVECDISSNQGASSFFVAPFPITNLNAFQYDRSAIIQYVQTYVWIWNSEDFKLTILYFDSVATREPIRYQVINYVTEITMTWTFNEFDSSSQDPTLFTLDPAIEGICS